MKRVSIVRLYLLRATYLLIAVGLGVDLWPAMLNRVATMNRMPAAVTCMLWAMSVLSLLGLRYPLQMLPLLFFELVWKSAWLFAVALPRWQTGRMDADFRETTIACLMGVIFPLVIPWGYVLDCYVRKVGDPWRRGARVTAVDPTAGRQVS